MVKNRFWAKGIIPFSLGYLNNKLLWLFFFFCPARSGNSETYESILSAPWSVGALYWSCNATLYFYLYILEVIIHHLQYFNKLLYFYCYRVGQYQNARIKANQNLVSNQTFIGLELIIFNYIFDKYPCNED